MFRNTNITKFTIVSFILFFQLFSSQTLGSRLDKNTLALGEVGTFTINISNLNGKAVQIAPKNELLPFHFEEIKDSISTTSEFYERTITFAVFEEGKYTIPAVNVKVGGEIYNTIPYEIEVINTAKKDDQISDIMNNKKVDLQFTDYWEMYKWYVLAGLAIIASIFAIIFIIKYAKKQKSSPKITTNLTLKELNALQKKKYIENNEFRSFYVEFIDITRNFIATQYHIPANVLLTDDLINLMKKTNSISPENEKALEDIFLRGDLVKFAKTFPDQAVMQQDFEIVKLFVQNSTKDLELDTLRNGV
ncbi:BatD family protein [Frigoriflavimonas asaccharolytica]|uniref:Oxygen tolerance protein BatD n=1 Tax=Frigoriflavimonas asaccharolytica TaxID=2735899 RepID=A0A8J8G814_9FLAO|nr:BatD family protein [Frigoriflavimonas asaccharolytica]NRS92873.1 hypothetical protein [Frigoriflavimonas asaccharolytica]